MSTLKEEIIQALAGNNNIQTVPQLADKLDKPVGMELLEALYQLRKEKLINWRPGKYLYLSRTGYEALSVS